MINVIADVITPLVIVIALIGYVTKRLPQRWFPVIVVATLSVGTLLTKGPETKTFWWHALLLAFVVVALVVRPPWQQPQR